MRILIAVGFTSLALLGGCKSDEQILAEARTQGLERCKTSPQAKQAPAGFDVDRFCTCLLDKTLSGKTVSQLENMKEAEQKTLGESAGRECAMQQMPAAPVPTGQVAGETAEEAVDEAE